MRTPCVQGQHLTDVWEGTKSLPTAAGERVGCGLLYMAICALGEPLHGVFVWASTTCTMGRSWEQSRRKA